MPRKPSGLGRTKPALFKGDLVNAGNVTVADSREGFVSWSDRGVLVFRPGTYTIPKPINEMTQKDLDAAWTPSVPTKPLTKRNRKPVAARKPKGRART